MIAPFTQLFEHMAWADARVQDSLRAMPTPDPRAIRLYAHILGAEHVWLARLTGQPRRVAVWPELTLDETEALAAENRAGFDALLAAMARESLARTVSYQNSAGQSFQSTVAEILTHVAMHGSYHRGQVALLVRDGGGEPAPTDFIFFARGVPAATHSPGR